MRTNSTAILLLVSALSLSPRPAAGNARQAPAATQPAKTFDGLDSALKVIPSGVLPSRMEGWTVAKIDVANDALEAQVKGQHITLRIKVGGISRPDNSSYRIESDSLATPAYANSLSFDFPRTAAIEVSRLNLGDEVEIEGRVEYLLFREANGSGPVTLEAYVTKCRVHKAQP